MTIDGQLLQFDFIVLHFIMWLPNVDHPVSLGKIVLGYISHVFKH